MTREEAIRILASSCIPGSKQKEALETLIPELAESEDERVRKEIIHYILYKANGVSEKQEHEWIAYLEKQKEQKPVESISQLAVQGKGVYKICPRCKERMVRDDSMVYTSMPPQYRYECPKCGESECDTVMYDNPEMKEQKPSINIDQLKSLMLQYLQEAANEKDDLDIEADTDKWARKILGYDFEQKPVDLSEMMVHKEPYIAPVPTPMVADEQKSVDYEAELKKCKDNPLYFYDKYVSIKLKPAKWSEEDERMLSRCIKSVECSKQFADSETYKAAKDVEMNWLKFLPERFNLQSKQEWSEEDRLHYVNVLEALEYVKGCKSDYDKIEAVKSDIAWFKSLKPSWKPSENELAKKHLDGYIMGREDTMREMKDFIESHFNTQSGTSTLKAEG